MNHHWDAPTEYLHNRRGMPLGRADRIYCDVGGHKPGQSQINQDWLPSNQLIPGFDIIGAREFASGSRNTVLVVRHRLSAHALTLSNFAYHGTHPTCEFVLIPGGRYWIGSTPNFMQQLPARASLDSQQVEIRSFLMARTLLRTTVHSGMAAITGLNNSGFGPVGINEYDPDNVARRLSEISELNYEDAEGNAEALGFRLPTEAEWEVACRAGTRTPHYSGPTWIQGPEDHNGFGLLEMLECGEQWCSDPYLPDVQPVTVGHDAVRPVRQEQLERMPRVVRGATKFSDERAARRRGFRSKTRLVYDIPLPTLTLAKIRQRFRLNPIPWI